MKKIYLIIIGVTAIVILLAIWVYLLIYGTPKPVEQFFTDFSFGNNETPIAIPEVYPEPEALVDVTSVVPLRQLTTRPVIGYGEQGDKDLLYVEAGTGHVYKIDLITGNETRLSNITIKNPESAHFSPDGKLVAIRSGFGIQNYIELLTLAGENEAISETLIPPMVDFTFNQNNDLLYTEYSPNGLLGRAFDPLTKANQTIFSVPFQSATIIWSTNNSTEHYVYPKATSGLTGFLYKIKNNRLLREPASGKGLMAEVNSDYFIYTITTSNGPISYAMNLNTKKISALSLLVQPDKCVFSKINTDKVYCGYENKNLTYEYPDTWYKGQISFSDKIFEIDLKRELSRQLFNPQIEIGREIDITETNISHTDKVLYFINKNDNTLWMYEI